MSPYSAQSLDGETSPLDKLCDTLGSNSTNTCRTIPSGHERPSSTTGSNHSRSSPVLQMLLIPDRPTVTLAIPCCIPASVHCSKPNSSLCLTVYFDYMGADRVRRESPGNDISFSTYFFHLNTVPFL